MTNVQDIPEVESSPAKPRNARRRAPTVEWGDDGLVVGWAYRVPHAFRGALDIAYTERIEKVTLPDGSVRRRKALVWTEGSPPAFAFRATDVLSSRDLIPGNAHHGKRLLVVMDSTADTVEARTIVPGRIVFRLLEWESGAYVERFIRNVTQADFVEILRTGCL